MDTESREMFQKLFVKIDAMDTRFDSVENRLDSMDHRLDSMENRLDVMEVKQNKMHEQLTELQISQKLFEMNTTKKIARLQDGMDTIEEILKLNELLPR